MTDTLKPTLAQQGFKFVKDTIPKNEVHIVVETDGVNTTFGFSADHKIKTNMMIRAYTDVVFLPVNTSYKAGVEFSWKPGQK